jgi:hypothetical protein
MTMATPCIDRRFCGPRGSGNGGYTAGRLGALIGDPAEITLRRPPPLETEMRVERAGSPRRRKATAGSALFTADGELCAYSKQRWIRLET